MTVTAEQTPPPSPDQPQCGCCDRRLPREKLTELGSTPGVFICASCARWAARRLHGRVPRLLAGVVRRLRTRPGTGARRRPRDGQFSAAMPILPVRDLARTEAFYLLLGFAVTFRHPDYLIMRAGPVEIHFGQESAPVPTSCYLDATDAGRIWKHLRRNDIEGLGPVEDFDYGMREFVITDPDGNRLRVGSPIPD